MTLVKKAGSINLELGYNIVSDADLTIAAEQLHEHLQAQPLRVAVLKRPAEVTSASLSRTKHGQFADLAAQPIR